MISASRFQSHTIFLKYDTSTEIPQRVNIFSCSIWISHLNNSDQYSQQLKKYLKTTHCSDHEQISWAGSFSYSMWSLPQYFQSQIAQDRILRGIFDSFSLSHPNQSPNLWIHSYKYYSNPHSALHPHCSWFTLLLCFPSLEDCGRLLTEHPSFCVFPHHILTTEMKSGLPKTHVWAYNSLSYKSRMDTIHLWGKVQRDL